MAWLHENREEFKNAVYRADYETVTYRILEEQIPYDTCIEAVRKIAESGLFVE